jgi:hypothetical protein
MKELFRNLKSSFFSYKNVCFNLSIDFPPCMIHFIFHSFFLKARKIYKKFNDVKEYDRLVVLYSELTCYKIKRKFATHNTSNVV